MTRLHTNYLFIAYLVMTRLHTICTYSSLPLFVVLVYNTVFTEHVSGEILAGTEIPGGRGGGNRVGVGEGCRLYLTLHCHCLNDCALITHLYPLSHVKDA